MFSTLIKNGTLIDGTGKPMFKADIGIKEGMIKEIGDLHNEDGRVVIDATGKYVAPGFVDINNHSDTYWRIFLNPNLPSLVHQGITTIIGGTCGSSLAPLVSKEIIQSIQKWANIKEINLNWLSMGEFLDEVEKRPLPVNFGTMVGHGTLRRGLLLDDPRQLKDQEIKVLKKMLKNALRDGALGFSSGLVYTHAKIASAKEIEELIEIVDSFGGVYATHIRGEAHELIEAVEEAIKVAKISGVSLEISHLKAMGEKNWPLMKQALEKIEEAQSDGVDIAFDVYPYAATGSVLYILLPDWVAEGGKKVMIHRLKDPAIRKQVIEEMRQESFDYAKVEIAISPLNKTLSRKKIVEISRAQEKSVEETIIDILVASEGRVITTMHVLSEENVARAIRHPFSLIASNGAGYALEHGQTGELVHPRSFGAFTRVLGKYVREDRVLSWEEAIRKMSGRPAEKFNLKKRGTLTEGNFADIVVFNPKEVRDLATFENPYQYAAGIEWVLVNGEAVLENGKETERRPGKVLRRSSFSF